jgi:hypothetical protein
MAGWQGRRCGQLAVAPSGKLAGASPEKVFSSYGADREEEENGAKLTRCSMTAMERCRRRAAMRGGRDHGCPPGIGSREDQERASGRWMTAP